MSILRIKNSKGEWVDIPAIKGADGKDGEVTLEQLKSITGELENLPTTDKSNLVNAINEVFTTMANGGGEGLIPLTENVSIDSLTPGIYINATTSSISISSMLSVSAGQLLICNSLIREGFSTNHIAFTMKMDNYINGNLQINLLHGSGTTLKTKSYMLTENPLNVKDQQTITGKKTFGTLPESSVTPTTNNQLVNKKYVDDAMTASITTVLEGEY